MYQLHIVKAIAFRTFVYISRRKYIGHIVGGPRDVVAMVSVYRIDVSRAR